YLLSMRILKFGGSTVRSASHFRQVLQIMSEKHRDGPMHVVVPALQGVTDHLERSAEDASHGGPQLREPLGDMEDRHISLVRELVSVERQSAVLTKLKLFFNELDDVLHGVALTHELTDRIRDFVLSFGERLSAFILANALQEAGVPARFVDARDLIKTDHGFGGARVNADQSYANIREQLANETYVGIITGFIGSTEQGVT